MNDRTLNDKLQALTERVLNELRAKSRTDETDDRLELVNVHLAPRFRRKFGTANASGRIRVASFLVASTEPGAAAVLDNTLRHEIAHVLDACESGHGASWKRWAVWCGARPDRLVQVHAAMPEWVAAQTKARRERTGDWQDAATSARVDLGPRQAVKARKTWARWETHADEALQGPTYSVRGGGVIVPARFTNRQCKAALAKVAARARIRADQARRGPDSLRRMMGF